MPYKRKGSPYYQIRLRLKGFGRTPVLTTGVTNKAVAKNMERALTEVAERALIDDTYAKVLEAVLNREIDLPTFLRYKNTGITELRRRVNDPPLEPIIERMLERDKDDGTRIGLRHLKDLAPGFRLSKLREPKTVRSLCEDLEATGLKRNSVRRTLHRGISKILRQEFGNAERDRVMQSADYKSVDDSRKVNLTIDQIKDLIDAADGEFRIMLLTAVLTGADRGVLSRLRVSDLNLLVDTSGRYSGSVYLGSDRKTKGRSRSVGFGHTLGSALAGLCRGKAARDQVFSITYSQIDYLWQRTREKARLPNLRFKDLRHVFAVLAHRAGISLSIVKAGLGHDRLSTTTRYTDRDTVFDSTHAEAIEGLLKRAG